MALSRTVARRLAWGMAAATVVMTVVGLGYAFASRHVPLPADTFAFRGFNSIIALEFAAVGLILALKRPSNPLGWLFLVGAMFSGLTQLSDGFAIWAVAGKGSTTIVARLAAVAAEWLWIVTFTMLAIALTLFPDGRPLSKRVGRWIRVCIAGVAVAVVASALTDRPTVYTEADNPLGVPGASAVANAALVFFLLLLVTGLASLVIRFRRSSGDEHQQVKWLAASTAFLVAAFVFYVLSILVKGSNVGDTAAVNVAETTMIVGLCSVPLSIAIAILTHRLYDIDVVIKKTVIFATVVVAVTAFYVLVAIILPAAVVGLGSGFEVGAVLIGAVIGLSIIPIRNRARRFADRLVYGKRATPYEVLEEFSGRMSEAYATEDVLPRMARILYEAVGAERALVWLRIGDELRANGRWPQDLSPPPSVRLSGGAIPSLDSDLVVPVLHQDELLGALAVAMPVNDPMDPDRERLAHGLASQAGLVLRNVRLIEELKASRQRLVAAQDHERRRIERNIHDGAQQQLVALAVRQRLAASMVGKDDDGARRMLDELQTQTNEALEDLRDLARGIYPPLLADKGLPAALEAQARKIVLPVTIEPDGVGRYAQEIESAIYFSVLEALQNVTKYADASAATVKLSTSDDRLTFRVTDDGRGFDSTSISYGTGLQGMADRLAALDGDLDVQSTPGRGTTVVGRVPVGSVLP